MIPSFVGTEWSTLRPFEFGYIAADDPAIAEYYGRMPSVS